MGSFFRQKKMKLHEGDGARRVVGRALNEARLLARNRADPRPTGRKKAGHAPKPPRMTPPCPVCSSTTHVNLLGGGTHGFYRYQCADDDCGTYWSQLPPARLLGGETDGRIRLGKRDAVYKCGRCGQPKRGHVCTFRDAAPSKPDLFPLDYGASVDLAALATELLEA